MELEKIVKAYLMNILYPPVSDKFVSVALKAISLAKRGLYHEKIEVPGYDILLSVSNIIDLLLLHKFVDKETR